MNETTARHVRTRATCVKIRTKFCFVFDVTRHFAQLFDAVSKLTLVAIATRIGRLPRRTELGLVALRHLHAVRHAAHVDLRRRRALAGEEAFGAQNDIELTVLLDDVAFAQRAGDDSHGETLGME